MSKIAITGATGFVGSHLVDFFLAQGFEVRALARSSSDLTHLKKTKAKIYFGDLKSKTPLEKFLRDIDFVIHTAGIIKVKNAREFFEVNTFGTQFLLGEIHKFSRSPKKFIFFSTLAAAGPCEASTGFKNFEPVSSYGKSKLLAEKEVLKYHAEFPVAILRLPPVYGPRDKEIFHFFKLAKWGTVFVLKGPKRYVSFIHASDVASACKALLENRNTTQNLFYLCDNHSYDYDEVLHHLEKAVGKKIRKICVPESIFYIAACLNEGFSKFTRGSPIFSRDKLREMKQLSWAYPSNLETSGYAWTPKIRLEQGFELTYQWYKKNHWL